MDDPNEHKDNELSDKNIDPNDIDPNEPIVTPEDADLSGKDDPDERAKAEEVANKQEKRWIDNINSGKKKLEDMPENLSWLKKRVEKKLDVKPVEKVDTKSEVRQVLAEERAEEDFEILVNDLKKADITADQDAELKEVYEDYLEEFSEPTIIQKLKALKFARKSIGLKDSSSIISERRRKGMQLPSSGTKKRITTTPDKETEIEKRLDKDLPRGFSSKPKE